MTHIHLVIRLGVFTRGLEFVYYLYLDRIDATGNRTHDRRNFVHNVERQVLQASRREEDLNPEEVVAYNILDNTPVIMFTTYI